MKTDHSFLSGFLTELLKEKERTSARVVGAAINTIVFYEAQDYDTAFSILKAAVDAHNVACRAYLTYLKAFSSPTDEKEIHRHAV